MGGKMKRYRYRIREPLLVGEKSSYIRLRQPAIDNLLASLHLRPIFLFDTDCTKFRDMRIGYAISRNGRVTFSTCQEIDHENLRPWFNIMGGGGDESEFDVEINGKLDCRFTQVDYIELVPNNECDGGGWLERL